MDDGLNMDRDDSYSTENILQYFDYLKKLKALEDTFKASNYNGMKFSPSGDNKPEVEEPEMKPRSRKRRSLAGSYIRGLGSVIWLRCDC